jgi:hypothetical protein
LKVEFHMHVALDHRAQCQDSMVFSLKCLLLIRDCFRLKDGENLVQSERVSWSKDRSKHFLTIDRARLNDAGCYSVTAHSEAGVVSSSAYLVVHGSIRLYS